jgi:uncharacterized repeat protein (TIGR01451 family)
MFVRTPAVAPRARPWAWLYRLASATMFAIAVLATGVTVASAQAQSPGSGLLVTFAARVCPTYTDITANRSRNNLQESLRDLGADTPYKPGEAINPAVEAANQPNCKPLPNWTFTLGTGYITRAVSGPWGSLSIVTGPFSSPSIVTQASTPLLDDQGVPTGESIAGASTVELTPQQAAIAARPNSLWAQGGTPEDPILNKQYPGEYGFGALRCALDDVNGDNVEWVGFPSGVRHVFCFAYYVQPPPTAGTIVIRKQIQGTAKTTELFPFKGNLSFNQNGLFSLAVKDGQAAQQSFIRAGTGPGEAPWNAQELLPANWKLTGLQCTSQSGHSTTSTDLTSATVSIVLADEDTVTCTYTDEFVPPNGGLTIRKLTVGATGRFDFAVQPAAGGQAEKAVAETLAPEVAVDASPSPISLAPGDYKLSETDPASSAGRWSLSGVECGGHALPATQPIAVSVVSGAGTTCTLTNTFTPLGSIALHKVTLGGLATTGFVISALSGEANELYQSATTTQQGVAAPAIGEPSNGLELGRYLIQETTPEPSGSGQWELTAVQCDGQDIPFADGQATVTLATSTPHQACTFTNMFHATLTPEPPQPPNPAQPETTKIDPSSRLTLTKRAVSSAIAVGQPASYEIAVTNHGPDASENVVVDDQPTGPARFHSVKPSQGSCTHTVPTTCQLGVIPAGHTVTIALTVIPTRAGAFENRAVLGSSSLDPSYTGGVAAARIMVKAAHSRRAPTHPEPAPHFTG